MSTLPPFPVKLDEKDEFECGKCGDSDLHIHYHPYGRQRHQLEPQLPYCETEYGSHPDEIAEHLDWTCNSCGYQWVTLPRDAES